MRRIVFILMPEFWRMKNEIFRNTNFSTNGKSKAKSLANGTLAFAEIFLLTEEKNSEEASL